MLQLSRVTSHPIFRAALTSGAVMAAGDVLCQAIQARAMGQRLKVDTRQTARFAVIGVTLHGPFFFTGFRWLDTRFGAAATLKQALVKSFVGQLTLFPVYTTAFFTYMGLLEGLAPRQCVAKLEQSLPRTVVTGSVFWPTVNLFNFMLVPPSGRVLYVNVCGLFWNAFLSWANTTYSTTLKVPPEEATGARR